MVHDPTYNSNASLSEHRAPLTKIQDWEIGEMTDNQWL